MSRLTPTTHHGHAFLLDTSDWDCKEREADHACELLQDWLCGLDAQDTAALHAALVDELEDRADPNDPPEIVQRARDAADQAREATYRAFHFQSRPGQGYNCDIAADVGQT